MTRFLIRRVVLGLITLWVIITLVFILYYTTSIGYLWFNVIGCAACLLFSVALQAMLGSSHHGPEAPATA